MTFLFRFAVRHIAHTAGLSPVQASVSAILAVDLLGVALVLEEFGQVIAAGGAWSTAVPIVLFLGALGAFFNSCRLWRSKGTWPIWQGTGWFLLTLMLISLSIPALAVLH